MCIKFDDSCFSRSRDIIGAQKFKMTRDPDHTHFKDARVTFKFIPNYCKTLKCDFSYNCSAVDNISTDIACWHGPSVVAELLMYRSGGIITYLPKRRGQLTLITPSSEVVYRVHASNLHDISV